MSQSKNTDEVEVEEHYQLEPEVVNKALRWRYFGRNGLTLRALI